MDVGWVLGRATALFVAGVVFSVALQTLHAEFDVAWDVSSSKKTQYSPRFDAITLEPQSLTCAGGSQ